MDIFKPENATREVLFNVSSTWEQIIMYALFALSIVIAGNGVIQRVCLWRRGRPDPIRFKNIFSRIFFIIPEIFLQRRVRSDRPAGVFHTIIVWAFIVLTFTTTVVFIDHDLGIKIFRGYFYLYVSLAADIFGALLLIAIALAYYRRVLLHPDKLHSARGDYFAIALLAILAIQGFILEGLRIHITDDPWALWSPVGLLFSYFFWSLSDASAKIVHYIFWWFHATSVFVFFAIIPYTKFFHIISSSLNLFYSLTERPKGALPYSGDIEAQMEIALSSPDGEFNFGRQSLGDFTWRELLELDACTSCGRCQDVCPAYNSGKVLSPKWLILDTKQHMLKLHAEEGKSSNSVFKKLDSYLLRKLQLEDSLLTSRGNNKEISNAVISLGSSWNDRLCGEVLSPDVFWSCTTCRACMEVCPVGIEHVPYIISARNNSLMVHAEVPSEAQASLRALETRDNPFGQKEARSDWVSGLDVKILSPGEEVDILYWVGCVSAFDVKKQKIAQSMAKILNHAKCNWGILGNRECCTGDPARRLGDENLFQTLAKKNIATLSEIKFSKIVANCPHCLNSLKNEYPDFGKLSQKTDFKILHHSEFINELVINKKISIDSDLTKSITFHDPCYLGRYNDTYLAPRNVLVQLSKNLKEMPRTKEKSFCCGAGGGHYFHDMKVGTRVNVMRSEEAENAGAEMVITACPFCHQMMEDGAKLRESPLLTSDIAEIVAEALK